MIVLVAYATVEGHTAKVAGRIAATVEQAGHQALLADLAQPGFAPAGREDGIILCAPIHSGRYPQSLVRFVQNWKSVLADKPSALVTVSLAIASDNGQERREAQAYPLRLKEETGWVPGHRHHAAGALKFLEYDFFKRWMMRRISLKESGPLDTSRDHELTDWSALEKFTMAFLQSLAKKV